MTPQVPALPRTRLVSALFGTLKLMQLYGRGHTATVEALDSLIEAIRSAAAEENEASVAVRGNRVQVNDSVLKAMDCGHLAVGFLIEEFGRRRIGRLRFLPSVRAADLDVFISSFLDLDAEKPHPAERLSASLVGAGISSILVEPRPERGDDPVVQEERRESAMRTYLSGLRAFREVLRFGGVTDQAKMRRARRGVQGLVDRFLEDETAVLALAQIRSFDEKLFNHSLNVCVYSLALGQRLGMSRRQLGELGMAALFHDLGKTVASRDADEMTRLREHPSRGARLLLQTATAQAGLLKSAIAAYEHHVQYDHGGFPTVDHETHVVSRIIAIADCFETLTSSRTEAHPPYKPHDAFLLMKSKAGTLFDPLLLKVFVNALGFYPAGTLVMISSGETAIVIGASADENVPDRPRVRIVRTAEGRLDPETIVDLAERDAGGAFVRSIVKTVPAYEVFPSVSDFVAAI